jgi:hypothetical protein
MADSSADRLAQRHARAKTTPSDEASAPGPSTRRRALLLWGIAALVLLVGYADLVRGGETIAPILLVLGYCVAVPLAILRG